MPQRLRLCLFIMVAGAALAACAQPQPTIPPAPAPPMIAPGQCNENAARFALGRAADTKLAEEARARAGAIRVRMVRPGEMVTMEFDPSRLTLEVDAAGKVFAARCG